MDARNLTGSATATPADGAATPHALAVGGLDPSAGAGVLLDAIVFSRLGFAPSTTVTALTAQNSRDFLGMWPVESAALAAQLDAVAADGPFACVKVGALGSAAAARALASWLKRETPPVVVVDPVTASSSGGSLFDSESTAAEAVMSLATVITPNAEEAAQMSGVLVRSVEDAASAAGVLGTRLGCAVLVTGLRCGAEGVASDVLWGGGEVSELRHSLVPGVGDVRGTGCMLATALCAHLASGLPTREATQAAHDTTHELLRFARLLGGGRRQVDLGSLLRS